MKILVVDDEEELRAMVDEFLELSGHQVHLAANGREALDILECGGVFDVLVTDWRMPVMSGIELIRKVQELPSNVGIVLMTGNATEGQMMNLAAIGVDYVLAKPFELEALHGAIKFAFSAASSRPADQPS